MAVADEPNEIEEKGIYLLYRRGERKHIQALYEKGELRINTMDYIKRCDENDERSDPEDGISMRHYLGDVTVTLADVGQDFSDGITLSGRDCLLMGKPTEKGNIYCLSGIYGHHLLGARENLVFDTSSFGQSLILIHNPKVFIDRVLKGLKAAGYHNVRNKRVNYYPKDYSGEVGIFRKNQRMSHQNEYRFFIPNSGDRAIIIYIGSLEDIATIKNNGLIKFTYTDNKQQIIQIGEGRT